MLLLTSIVMACAVPSVVVEGLKFGFDNDIYGDDLKFDGVAFNQLQYELDFPNDVFNPDLELLDAPVNISSRFRRQAAEDRALFRSWPRGSSFNVALGFIIPFRPKGQFEMRFPFIFFINELLRKINGAYGRHFVHDQFSMYRSLETGLADGLAMEGRGCMLRAICDAAELELAKFSLLGEMLSVLLTPKRSRLADMDEYTRAYKTGKKHGNCKKHYPECSLSLQSLFPAAWLARKK